MRARIAFCKNVFRIEALTLALAGRPGRLGLRDRLLDHALDHHSRLQPQPQRLSIDTVRFPIQVAARPAKEKPVIRPEPWLIPQLAGGDHAGEVAGDRKPANLSSASICDPLRQ